MSGMVRGTPGVVILAASVIASIQTLDVRALLSDHQPQKDSVNATLTTITDSSGPVQDISSEEARDIADHNDRVRDLAEEDASPLTDAERAASVEYVWQPGVGLIRQG